MCGRCDIDVEYFPGDGEALAEKVELLSVEDAELLAALRALASEDVTTPMLCGRHLGF